MKIKIYGISFLSSFCSFAFFTIFTKKMAQLTGQHVYTQTVLSSFYIFFLALSSFYVEKNKKRSIHSLPYVEFFMSIYFLLIPLVFSLFEYYYNLSNSIGEYDWFYFSFFIILPLGLLTGLELPLLFRKLEKHDGRVLFYSYLGSFLSSVLLITFFLNRFSLIELSLIFTLLNFILFLISTQLSNMSSKKFVSLVTVFTLTLFMIIPLSKRAVPLLHHMSFSELEGGNVFDYRNFQNRLELTKRNDSVDSYQTKYQRIDILNRRISFNFWGREEFKPQWKLYLDHRLQISQRGEKIYHQTMALYPLVFLPNVENILILGGGDLGIARELIKSSEKKTRKITLVELDRKMIDLSLNHSSLSKMHPNKERYKDIKIIYQDAFSYIKNSKSKYDLIYLDFPFPNSAELNKLYSKELYHFVGKSLTDNGAIVLDYPLLKDKALIDKIETLLGSLKKSGFKDFKVLGRGMSVMMASKNKISKASNTHLIEKYVDNIVLYNFIERTAEFKDLISKKELKYYSIFKPNLNFRISK